ncbi:MAG: hypothetical protein RL637_1336, partial [Pseudomonadota bacterium]
MKAYKFLILLWIVSLKIHAQTIDTDIIFQGIIKQSHDYTCGSAALSTLINGLIENSHISEANIMDNISSVNAEEQGYSAADLAKVSTQLGYPAQWRKIAKTELPKVKLPVLLLIGLNSEFPHYVVLKGIRNHEAYLADPIRGNIRIIYEDLIKESLNDKYPLWFVMAINPSKNKPQDSVLYLSDDENDLKTTHVTVEQSNTITLATLSKEKQWIIDYDFAANLNHNTLNNIKIKQQNFSHAFNARYGITNELQIGANFQYNDNYAQYHFEKVKLKQNNNNRAYGLSISNRFKIDDAGEYNLIAGLNGSYAEQNSIYGGEFNLTAYTNTQYGQFLIGGSIGKQFTHNDLIKFNLAEYFYSGFISANKPFGDRYLASLTFAINDAQAKNNLIQFKTNYSMSIGLSYILTKHFQLSPSFGYSFGESDNFSFGMNIA